MSRGEQIVSERHLAFFMIAKVSSAFLGLLSVSVFTRLAGPAQYGEYLIFFAYANIIYNLGFAWLRYSFFASYQVEREREQIATYMYAAVTGLLAVASVSAIAYVFGFMPRDLLLGAMSLVIALIVFECALEINRIHLNAGRISVAVVMRAALMFLFGLCALLLFGSGEALAVGAALGIMVGAAPLVPDLLQYRGGTVSKDLVARYFRYGWPLILSFGANASAQNADRLLLARFQDLSVVGPYGAATDIIRQLFTMPSEAISGAYIAVAKRTLEEGRDEEAREILRQAFRTYVAVAAFGCAYLLTFGELFIGVLLGDHVPDHFELLLPLLLGFSVCQMFRAYYFGQVIYFLDSSRLDLFSTVAMTVVTFAIAIFLIPDMGTFGAALSLVAGNFVGLVILMVPTGGRFTMPAPVEDGARIVFWAAVGYLVGYLVGETSVRQYVVLPLQFLVLTVTMAISFYAYNLFGARNQLQKIWPVSKWQNC
jgi:O-antigen/teichoic acid export membrane protein